MPDASDAGGRLTTPATAGANPPPTSAITPFQVAIPTRVVERIVERVRAFPWDALPPAPDGGSWQLGTAPTFLRALATHWCEGYDWRAAERGLNRFPQYLATVGDAGDAGQRLHFVHERGSPRPSGAAPVPLLLLHGWPYSFASFTDVVEPLAHPERVGGDAEDAFDVVVASLPGFGFSGRPTGPVGPKRMGDLLDELMTKTLGYARYLVQGGDWGGYIASRMGFDHAEHVLGVHSTSFMVRHDGAAMGSGLAGPDATEAERAWAAGEAAGFASQGAYSMIMGTRPQTLAYAMADSPVGQAAWLLEKFHAWADLRGRALEDVFPLDRLITEVMVYLVSDSFVTASWIYAAAFPERSATLPPGARVEVPTAFTAYPDPVFAPPPRSFMERSHRVVRWTEAPRGGHFPMLEVPAYFVEDLRKFSRRVRS